MYPSCVSRSKTRDANAGFIPSAVRQHVSYSIEQVVGDQLMIEGQRHCIVGETESQKDLFIWLDMPTPSTSEISKLRLGSQLSSSRP